MQILWFVCTNRAQSLWRLDVNHFHRFRYLIRRIVFHCDSRYCWIMEVWNSVNGILVHFLGLASHQTIELYVKFYNVNFLIGSRLILNDEADFVASAPRSALCRLVQRIQPYYLSYQPSWYFIGLISTSCLEHCIIKERSRLRAQQHRQPRELICLWSIRLCRPRTYQNLQIGDNSLFLQADSGASSVWQINIETEWRAS